MMSIRCNDIILSKINNNSRCHIMSLTTYSLTGVILITLTQMYGQLVIVNFFKIIHILYIALGKPPTNQRLSY